MSITRFFVFFTIFAASVYASARLIQSGCSVPISAVSFNLIFGFLYILTSIAFLLSYFGIKSTPETGVFALLGGSVLKMLFALVFIFLLFRKSTENQFVLVLNFFSIYFLFTIFEVIVLLRILRDQNKT